MVEQRAWTSITNMLWGSYFYCISQSFYKWQEALKFISRSVSVRSSILVPSLPTIIIYGIFGRIVEKLVVLALASCSTSLTKRYVLWAAGRHKLMLFPAMNPDHSILFMKLVLPVDWAAIGNVRILLNTLNIIGDRCSDSYGRYGLEKKECNNKHSRVLERNIRREHHGSALNHPLWLQRIRLDFHKVKRSSQHSNTRIKNSQHPERTSEACILQNVIKPAQNSNKRSRGITSSSYLTN